MNVQDSALFGAANVADDVIQIPREEDIGISLENPNYSQCERINNSILDFLESDAFKYSYTAVTGGISAYSAASAMLASGGTAAAAAGAAWSVAAPILSGILAGAAGTWVGYNVTDWVASDWLGYEKVKTDGENPACVGDPIAHQNKNIAVLGAIFGAALVAVVTVTTGGVGLAAIAAAAGAGVIAGASKSISEYGANKGHIEDGSPNVFFENKAVARLGDSIFCSDHKETPNRLAEGAKTVFVNNLPLVRVGHRTTCDGNVNAGCATIVQTKQTSEIAIPIKDSRSPYLRWAAIVVDLIPWDKVAQNRGNSSNADAGAPPRRPSGDSPTQPTPNGAATASTSPHGSGDGPTSPAPLPRTSGDAPASATGRSAGGDAPSSNPGLDAPSSNPSPDVPSPRPVDGSTPASPHHNTAATESTVGNGVPSNRTTSAGEPVDMGTGDFIQRWPVIDLPGALPLRLTRLYRSKASFHGSFGPKWADDWAQTLHLADNTVTFRTEEGVELVFYTPDERVCARNLREGQYLLTGRRSGALRLYDRSTRTVRSFEYVQGAFRRLTDIDDLNGNRIHFDYAEDRLCEVRHSDGHSLRIETTPTGNIAEVVLLDPGHAETSLLRCEYDAQHRLTRCESFQFGTLFHAYDATGRMIEWRDADQTQVWIEYDQHDRVVATDSKTGLYQDRYEYDDAACCIHYYDAEGGHSRYYYNVDGLVTRRVDPAGNEWRTEWDEWTRRCSETDPLGRTTRFFYNPFGEMIQVVAPDGATQRFVYDTRGNLIKNIAANGAQWTFEYDDRCNLLQTIDPYGRRQRYRVGDRGEVLCLDSADGTQWRYRYDDRYRLSEVIRPDGEHSFMHLDVFGRVRTLEDSLGQFTHFEYAAGHAHPRGSASAVTLPNGVRQEMQYDREHRLTVITNGEGHPRYFHYGALDLLEKTIAAGGQGLRLEYDRLARLTQVTNGVGDTYRYEYDQAGHVVAQIDFTGTRTRYEYNAVGWLVRKRHANGTKIDYDYDLGSGRLTFIRQQNSRGTEEVIQFDYDVQGALVKVTSPAAVVEYERDRFGLILSETLNGRTVRCEYDAQTGRPVSQHGEMGVQWSYDSNGALIRLTIDGHAPLEIQRDALGRDVFRRSAAGFTLQQTYDPCGLLQAQLAGTRLPDIKPAGPMPPGNDASVRRQYRYDRAFNPLQIDDSRWGSARYGYNASDLLVSAQFDNAPARPMSRMGWDYDAAMNLIARSESQQPGVIQESLRQQGGRIVQRGNSRYRYDRRGRLVEKIVVRDGFRPRHWHFRWNTDNRLIELLTPENERWQYAYDAFGRRVRKFKLIRGGAKPPGPGTAMKPEPVRRAGKRGLALDTVIGEEYLWSGDQLIEAAPIYADGRVAWDKAVAWAYAPGSATPMAQKKGDELWYVVADHLGAPRELLDETGKVVWSNSPEPWGQARIWTRQAANDDAVDCPHRMPGQYFDPESGLHYNRHRYYDPETGQYLAPDPLGLAGGVRPQGYVDNPNTMVDPLGLASCPVFDPRLNHGRGGWRDPVTGRITKAPEPYAGQTVYRVYGGDSQANGASWSPANPGTVADYRGAAGLPSGGDSGYNNTGRFVIEATITDPSAVKLTRSALPLDGNAGGLPEYIIPDAINSGSVDVVRVSGVNPEF